MATAIQGKRGRKQVDPNESPQDRFKRLATGRMNRAISGIKSVGQLASASYEYTDEQREKIEDTLRKEVEVTCAALQDHKLPVAGGFRLD